MTSNASSAPPRSPCCSFVPPYLLRQIAESTKDKSLMARREQTLAVDERLRARREAASPATRPVAPDTSGNRVVYDAGHTEELPGRAVRGADDPATGDAAVDEAYDYSGRPGTCSSSSSAGAASTATAPR